MTYRPKPAMAAWIQGERKRAGWSTKELSERLALVGVKVGEQTISVWESYAGRKPSAANIDALERLFGSQAPERQAESQGDVAAALDRQTQAIEALTRALESRFADLQGAEEGRADALQALLAQLVKRSSGNAGGRERQHAAKR